MSELPPPVPSKDVEHLKLLALFHYIVGGLGAFFACFPLFHVAFGLMMIVNPTMVGGHDAEPPPPFLGYMMAGMGLFFVVIGWTAAICTIVSGRMIAQRRNWMFSFVVAVILCLFMPFGTVLGIFTIIVLSRDSVKRLYGKPV